jgi:hypothetical protein
MHASRVVAGVSATTIGRGERLAGQYLNIGNIEKNTRITSESGGRIGKYQVFSLLRVYSTREARDGEW